MLGLNPANRPMNEDVPSHIMIRLVKRSLIALDTNAEP